MHAAIFFNAAIENKANSPLESFANGCLYPVRYLFQGRTIEIIEDKVLKNSPSAPTRNLIKTIYAIVFLVPALLLGIPAKLLSYHSPVARENFRLVNDFYSNPAPELDLQPAESSDSLFDLNAIYNPDGFSYSLPRNILENFLNGTAFDNKTEYTDEEKEALRQDIESIYNSIGRIEKDETDPRAIMTAGAPGAGKTVLMREKCYSLLPEQKGIPLPYICPDDICLKEMQRTYQKELNQKIASLTPLDFEGEKTIRLEMYNKWRPASNGATHLILANLIRHNSDFYFGTTSTGPATGVFFQFLKDKGYKIRLLHLSAPDDVRWESIKKRDRTFVQTTEEDIRIKGDLLPQRIMDTYLKFADEIEFYWRGHVDADPIKTATWFRNPPKAEKLGTLEVVDEYLYLKIKNLHDSICGKLNKPELSWHNTVTANSTVLVQKRLPELY